MKRREIDGLLKKAFPVASTEQMELSRERIRRRLASRNTSASAAAQSVLTLTTARRLRWYWAVVAAVAVAVIVIPISKRESDRRARIQEQARIKEDVMLMQAVEADRSRVVPASLQRVMTLLPKDEPTAISGRSQ